MKTIHFILAITFSFTMVTSCSKDEDSNTIVEESFLEKYEGTVWHIAINEFNSEYIKFHNNESVPFERWLLIYGQGCYEHINYNISDFDATITENSEEYLEVTFGSDHVWIIAIEEDVLYWIDVSQEGVTDYIFEKQSLGIIDDLEICL